MKKQIVIPWYILRRLSQCTAMYSVNNNMLRIKLVATGNLEAVNADSSGRGLKIPLKKSSSSSPNNDNNTNLSQIKHVAVKR